MIYDLIVALLIAGAFIAGYRNGLVKTLLRTIFFFAGAVAGMYLVVHYNKSGWLIVSIIVGAYSAAFIGTLIAKALKVTIIRGPLRWIDNLAGALFEAAKYVVLAYIIGVILLYAPWAPGRDSVQNSQIFNKIDRYAPSVITEVRAQVEKLLNEVN